MAETPHPEENIQALVEAAERRKEAEIKKIGGKFTLFVTLPILALFLWAGLFLATYDAGPPAPAAPEPVVQTGELTAEQKEMAQYDLFRDEKDRVIKTNALGLEKTSEKLIDKDDVHFAMELLNFMQPPDTHAKAVKH